MSATARLRSPAALPWVHAWAVLTVVCTLPLLLLGAQVTTLDAGMSDPVGYRHPWELLQLLADAIGLGLQIEYSHRVAGFVVGLAAIVLAVSMAIVDRRPILRWLGTVALLLVCMQGMLGMFRVNLNALFGRNLALVHGAFAQLVIAMLVSVALVTSRGWLRDTDDAAAAPALRRWALLTAALVYVQLILGGVVRHRDFLLGSRLHVVGSFVVFAAVLWLIKLARDSERRSSLAAPSCMLALLLSVQILLGIEAWLARAQLFFAPAGMPLSMVADGARSLHYVIGTLLFATTVVLVLKTQRRTVVLPYPAPVTRLEGAL